MSLMKDNELESITTAKTEALLKIIKEGKPFDISYALTSIFLLLNTKSKEIEDLNAKITSLENKLNKMESKNFEKQILIKKIPKRSAVKRHSKESSIERVWALKVSKK